MTAFPLAESEPVRPPSGLLSRLGAVAAILTRPLAVLFYGGGDALGLALSGVLAVMNPRAAVFAAAAIALGHAAARTAGWPRAMREDGGLTYNVALVGLGAAWITEASHPGPGVVIGLVVATTLAALTLAAALRQWLPRHAALPPLSLAFVVVFGAMLTLFPLWGAAAVWASPPPLILPAALSLETLRLMPVGFLRSLGTILFLPDPWAGALVLVALTAWSRLAALGAVCGYIGGFAMVALLQGLDVQWSGLAAGHNYLLAGLALGTVYFVPGWAGLALGAGSGALAALFAALVQHALRGSGWDFLPLPYILTVWTVLCASRLRERAGALVPAPELPPGPAAGPEACWRAAQEARHRVSGAGQIHLISPVVPACRVTQGFDGAWSHRGAWRHALDLELVDEDGRPCPPGREDDLTAYHSFGLAVHAPAAGWVVRVIDHVPDNRPGHLNLAANWGNLVVIALDQGGHALLAHFAQASVWVRPGQRVEIGAPLGLCGNSGRSLIPHLHLQAQAGADIGAPTLPFRLTNLLTPTADGPRWDGAIQPAEGARIQGAAPDPAALATLASLTPGSALYQLEAKGAAARRFAGGAEVQALSLTLDDAGRLVFADEAGARLTLAVGPAALGGVELTGRASGLLGGLWLALATVPYAGAPGLWWRDSLPTRPLKGPVGRWLGDLADPFVPPRRLALFGRHAPASEGESEGEGAGSRTVVARIDGAGRGQPRRVTARIAPARGVTRLDLDFADGALGFTQIWFAPGMAAAEASAASFTCY